MNGKARIKTLVLDVVVVGCCAGCTMTTVRQHPEFLARCTEISRVGIMPTETNVVLIKFAGDHERPTEEEKAICKRAPQVLKSEMEKRGFRVIESGWSEGDPEEDSELRYELSRIQSAFAANLSELYPRDSTGFLSKSDAFNIAATLGSDVNLFADYLDVDALLFARCVGFRKSPGEIAKDAAMTVLVAVATVGSGVTLMPLHRAIFFVALVDGTTGHILWADFAHTERDFQEKNLDRLLSKPFDSFSGGEKQEEEPGRGDKIRDVPESPPITATTQRPPASAID